MDDVPMRSAIEAGDVERVRVIVGDDPGAAERLFWWSDPRGGGDEAAPISYVSLARFHAKAEHDRMGEIARVLLAAGAAPDGPADAAETPVVTAASYDEPEVAAALIGAGADPVGRGFAAPGGTALAHAVFFGNPTVGAALAAQGAPIQTLAEAAGLGRLDDQALNGADDAALTLCLRAAAVCEQLDSIDRVLRAGLPLGTEIDGATALHWAAFFGKPAAVRRLVERGADPTCREPAHNGAPLDWARYRHRELFRPSPGHDEVETYLSAL